MPIFNTAKLRGLCAVIIQAILVVSVVAIPNDLTPLYTLRPGNTHFLTINDQVYGHRNLTYFVTNGLAVIDGDVIYGPVDTLTRNVSPGTQARAFSVATTSGDLWPSGIVKYKYDSDATEKILKPIVDGAIARWLAGAPYLTFTKVANSNVGQNGITMISAPVCGGCNSAIGYANAPRNMNLQQSCPSAPGTCGTNEATHEFGHLLGLYHEHQRPDRESTVHYNCANVAPACPTGVSMPAGKTCCNTGLPGGCCSNVGNFNIISGSNIDSKGAYDVNSIMQYRQDAFANPGTFTLTPARSGVTIPAGNPANPDTSDFNRICKLYANICPKAKTCRSSSCPTTCQNVPKCNKPSLCDRPPGPPCCDPINCAPIISRCTALGCDFLK